MDNSRPSRLAGRGGRSAKAAGRAVVLEDVGWRTYERLLRTFAGRHDVRLTYDRGRLEIMSPLLEHEDDGRFLGRLVIVSTEELNRPVKSGGSTTMRRQLKQRGIEADESFWIDNAPRMQGRRRLDLRRDPPPDLAIEVDVSHGSLDRLAIYAALKVPEVWRLEGDVLRFHVLRSDGAYVEAPRSLAFPMISPADLLRFLHKARKAGDQNPVVREFRSWLRRRRD
jgi:Uma2 family endonuclease